MQFINISLSILASGQIELKNLDKYIILSLQSNIENFTMHELQRRDES